MKYSVIVSIVVLLIVGCGEVDTSIKVTNQDELNAAIADAQPGDDIVMVDGVWEDVRIRLLGYGTEGKPITLKAETPGGVVIQGTSDLQLGGEYLVVDGLHFKNGAAPESAVIAFAVSKDTVANHSILTNCVIEDYNKAQRDQTDLWVLFQGRHNQMDHCYLTGKSNRGPTVRVDLEGNRNINNYHQITDNHFGPRPPKGGPSAETLQIGNSYTSMSPSYTYVARNLFDRCNGEVEIISSKTNFNEFRNNVFYKSEGSLVTRHGNYCTVDGNYFIGEEGSPNVGGIRLIGTGHTATNNYFYNLNGRDFRGPLAVMNGIPKSPLNRYIQVTDVIVAYNTWVNCTAPWQLGVGSNVDQKDVLPASEIRSARPIRTIVANNIIYNATGDKTPILAFDKLDGIQFESNVINNQGVDFEGVKGLESMSFELKPLSEDVWTPAADFPDVAVYNGFGFDAFAKDLFGKSRATDNAVGAVVGHPASAPPILDKSKYGADWYDTESKKRTPITHAVSASMNIADVIAKAAEGDIVTLAAGNYKILTSLKMNKSITIESAGSGANVTLTYSGGKDTPLFEMNPKGELTLKGINLRGTGTQNAFASLKENMSSLYNLTLDNCTVDGFNYILRAYKYSFSEHIILKNSKFSNCKNGLELSQEIEDKGEYNAENMTIDNCQFDAIAANVIDYYRGGYDESTVGGNLILTNSTFTNSGAKEKNGILINTYGIINVDISSNTFKNNKVKLVAQLWGAKNNSHSNNVISNSGKIAVEENLKLNLLY